MQRKSFGILAAVTGIVVVAAAISVSTQRSPTVFPKDNERAFPKLAEGVNDVDSITVQSNEATFTIVKTDKGWGLKEKSSYPVHFDKVKGTIVGLSELKLLEGKTSDPKRYARLEVEDPTSKDAKSVRVTLKSADKGVLAAGIIGKRNPNLLGDSGGGTYLRRGDEAQSWLTQGEVEIGKKPNDWVIRDIVNIDAENIKKAEIVQPDGKKLVVRNTSKKDGKFSIDGIPKGFKLKNDSEPKDIAGGMWRLTLEDVKAASAVPFPEKVSVAEYETFDGLKVRAEIAMVDDVRWGRFTASIADTAASDDKAKEKVKKKVEEINARTTGWVYELSAGEGERLTTKLDDIIEKKEEKKESS